MANRSFYSSPDIYDLYHIYHSEKLENLLQKHYEKILGKRDISSILDCSFGTGNITFILSKMGYKISGSDISGEMLSKAKEKADNLELKTELVQCDFRNLTSYWNKTFDCVMSTGNSLAHVNNSDLKKVLCEMDKLIRKGGYLYFDSRNWDLVLRRKQRFYYYNPFYKDDYRINIMQVWDYNNDSTITFNILHSYEKEQLIEKREEYIEVYYPFSRECVLEELEKLGYTNIEIHNYLSDKINDYEKMEWYCIIAQKP